jgi:lysophospholipase L1-like esterase
MRGKAITMKTIVCFGDSNTWGAIPLQGPRYDLLRLNMEQRWPGIMRNLLGAEYWIIEEGLCGRTTVCEDPLERGECGKEYIVPCIQSHTPVDLVTIMLGTNDLKKRFSLPAVDIAKGAGVLVDMVRKINYPFGCQTPQVLLIAPPPILEVGRLKENFEGGAEKSLKFGVYYADIAATCGCHFIDAGKIINSSPDDGIHFNVAEHAKLGKAVAEKIREILVYGASLPSREAELINGRLCSSEKASGRRVAHG